MKNIIKTSKKLITAGLATIATLSLATALTATPATAEGDHSYSQNRFKNHGHHGSKYRAHKKYYKHQKRSKRVKRHVQTDHYYDDKTYKHQRKHSGHVNNYHYDDGNSAAVAAGIIGFALGTIVGSSGR